MYVFLILSAHTVGLPKSACFRHTLRRTPFRPFYNANNTRVCQICSSWWSYAIRSETRNGTTLKPTIARWRRKSSMKSISFAGHSPLRLYFYITSIPNLAFATRSGNETGGVTPWHRQACHPTLPPRLRPLRPAHQHPGSLRHRRHHRPSERASFAGPYLPCHHRRP